VSTIVTFGETMLRLAPKDPGDRLARSREFRVEPGGSESNVAIALATLGHRTFHLTRLPQGPLGDLVVSHLRGLGVETGRIQRGGERVGCYWTEMGQGPRPGRVIYDRENSAFAAWPPGEVDWSAALAGADWLHTSGITPALSARSAQTLTQGLGTKLWRYLTGDATGEAGRIMAGLCHRCHLVLGNETDWGDVFGWEPEEAASLEQAHLPVARAAFERFKELEAVAMSQRVSHSASVNTWSGLLYLRPPNGGGVRSFQGPVFELHSIVDRVGAGDAFAAGIIHGLLSWPGRPQEVVDFAVTLSALEHTLRGDACTFSQTEVLEALASKGSGRIIR